MSSPRVHSSAVGGLPATLRHKKAQRSVLARRISRENKGRVKPALKHSVVPAAITCRKERWRFTNDQYLLACVPCGIIAVGHRTRLVHLAGVHIGKTAR